MRYFQLKRDASFDGDFLGSTYFIEITWGLFGDNLAMIGYYFGMTSDHLVILGNDLENSWSLVGQYLGVTLVDLVTSFWLMAEQVLMQQMAIFESWEAAGILNIRGWMIDGVAYAWMVSQCTARISIQYEFSHQRSKALLKGRYSKKQNGHFYWHFPWRGGGVSRAIFFVKNI